MGGLIRKATFEDFESSTKNSRYLRITHSMMTSLAWKVLSSYEVNLYIHLKSKYRFNNRTGNSNARNISFTYEEGKKLMGTKRFTKAIDCLLELGFIDLVEHWGQSKKPTIFGLSTRWRDYGTDKFVKKTRPKAKPRRAK